ncbi:hypothetical protein PO909_027416, partial [Leuciscus waleckii]
MSRRQCEVSVVWCTKDDGEETASVMLQTPKIIRQYKPCSSKGSSSDCVLLCSVANAPNATLTMYKDNTVFSENKYADLNIDLSLCLEVENQDNSTYSCVINNPTSNKTKHLNISQLCQDCKYISQTPVSVMEGDSVTLHTNITEVQMEDHLMWMFECLHPQLILIAEILNKVAVVTDCENLRSRDRLQLDSQTGNLTIKNTSKEDSGVYKLLFNSPDSRCWSYDVYVHAHLPVPVITNNSLQCSSSSSESICSLLCYALNVSHVTLSWYKEISLLSSISVSDDNNSISLCLEVEYQDKNTYSCVIYNPISNQTTHLDISELCPVQSNDHIWEYVGVGVAAVGVVVLIGAIVRFCFCNRNQA